MLGRLPELPVRAAFALAADAAWWRRGPGVARLEANLRRAVPRAANAELRALSRAALRSYLRYWCDAFRMPAWTPEHLRAVTRVEGLEPLADALRAGTGAVGFLGHLGSWDQVGAWGALELAPVTTVAERLEPPALFDAFVGFRRRLGIDVVPLTGGATFGHLVRTLRAGGFVPLLADRDLTATGVGVRLLGEPARAAAGPARLALATGAPLFPVTVRYERLAAPAPGRGPRWGVVATVHPAVPVPPRTASSGRAEQVTAMTQACVDAVSAAVRARPEDWHMLQAVFDADTGAGAEVSR